MELGFKYFIVETSKGYELKFSHGDLTQALQEELTKDKWFSILYKGFINTVEGFNKVNSLIGKANKEGKFDSSLFKDLDSLEFEEGRKKAIDDGRPFREFL